MLIDEKAYRQAECECRFGCREKALREFVEAYEAAREPERESSLGPLIVTLAMLKRIVKEWEENNTLFNWTAEEARELVKNIEDESRRGTDHG